jgi:hypothetical protein
LINKSWVVSLKKAMFQKKSILSKKHGQQGKIEGGDEATKHEVTLLT